MMQVVKLMELECARALLSASENISSLPLAGERPGERVGRSLQLFEYTGFPRALSLTLSRMRERECPVCLLRWSWISTSV